MAEGERLQLHRWPAGAAVVDLSCCCWRLGAGLEPLVNREVELLADKSERLMFRERLAGVGLPPPIRGLMPRIVCNIGSSHIRLHGTVGRFVTWPVIMRRQPLFRLVKTVRANCLLNATTRGFSVFYETRAKKKCHPHS